MPDLNDEAQRAELMDHLVARFGEQRVAEAAARLPLFTVAVELSDPPPTRISARELAARANVDLDDVLLIRAALGFPVQDVDAPSVPEWAVDDVAIARSAIDIFGRDSTLAFARVLGAATQQIAEAGRAFFATSLVDGDSTLPTELELSQQNEIAWAAWRSLPSVLEHTMVELGDAAQGLVTEILSGELVRAVGFVDLVGSTDWIGTTSADVQTAALIRFESEAWGASTRRGGRLVKLIGDEAMIVAGDVAAACAIVADLLAFIALDPDLPEGRGGVAFGPVVARAGDYFGPVVNLAARAAAISEPGAIVVPAALATEVGDGWQREALGAVALRGFNERRELTSLRRS